jgi:hypothetical protein
MPLWRRSKFGYRALEPVETALPAWLAKSPPRRQMALHRVPAAPQCPGNSPRPPTQLVQPHHRRPPPPVPASSPPADPTRTESFAPRLLPSFVLLSERSVSDVVRGSLFHVVNQHRSGTLAKTAASNRKRGRKSPKWRSRSAPIGAPPETKTSSVYQGVEAYPRWGPASALIHIFSTPRVPEDVMAHPSAPQLWP